VAKGGIDQTRFYLCHAAAWCVADSPLGPWVATAELPTPLYPIPADSPSYAVTDVQAIEPSNDEIDRLRLQGSAIVARG
jgi:hypothetical protein